MVSPELLSILCCPETRQTLKPADAALLDRLNQKIALGTLRNRAGRAVAETITEGLLRADGKFCYPVRNDIPVLLIDEAIAVD